MKISYDDINDYWFSSRVQPFWFNSTPEFDLALKSRFETVWEQAKEGKYLQWETTPKGLVALILIYDQFPLNMFRGQAKSFSTEAKARECSLMLINNGWDTQFDVTHRSFIYLPFMHSESTQDQDLSFKLFSAPGFENNLRWAKHHRDLIYRFGRFPHRNEILGRQSTEEELSYLLSEKAFHG